MFALTIRNKKSFFSELYWIVGAPGKSIVRGSWTRNAPKVLISAANLNSPRSLQYDVTSQRLTCLMSCVIFYALILVLTIIKLAVLLVCFSILGSTGWSTHLLKAQRQTVLISKATSTQKEQKRSSHTRCFNDVVCIL